MVLTTKYSLGQEVWYGDKHQRRKGEIIAIIFDGSFNNIPIYEIGYVGNVWCEDEVSESEQQIMVANHHPQNKGR